MTEAVKDSIDSSDAGTVSVKMYRPDTRVIHSLDSARLQPSDFYDISGKAEPIFRFISTGDTLSTSKRHASFPYMWLTGTAAGPFPKGTHGFLYFHTSQTALIASQIRFRVTADGQSSSAFADGHDLLLPDGTPWKLELSHILHFKSWNTLLDLLYTENPSLKSITKDDTFAHRSRIIRSLDPLRLKATDFHDISNSLRPRYAIEDPDSQSLLYTTILYEMVAMKNDGRFTFPPGTHGFLYYVHPTLMEAGQLRFRITKNDNPSSFAEGKDLTFSSGLPWHMVVRSHPKYDAFLQLLRKDNLVKDEHSANVPQIEGSNGHISVDLRMPRIRTRNPIVTSFGQPFAINLRFTAFSIWVSSGKEIRAFQLQHPLKRHGRMVLRYISGRMLCCFEPSPLPEHKGKRNVAIRLLKMMEPLQLHPNSAGEITMRPPEEGQLIMQHDRVWTYDANKNNKAGRGLRLLFEMGANALASNGDNEQQLAQPVQPPSQDEAEPLSDDRSRLAEALQ
ncbi:hypothetical protein EW146_g6894 [Bondarzewia mesenterica]|uniref:Uncharacterized protein n=1 Tax=Bondarzewia mesenterica TaxID=1095465 RepID=A0A4S4LMG3_9AGAM|nr:hypothetical protein EW146_g6894 [Bondarzewia mesenterica]